MLTCNVIGVFVLDDLDSFLFGNRLTAFHIAFNGFFKLFFVWRGFIRQSFYLFLDFFFFFFFGLPRLLPYDLVPYGITTPNNFWLFL